MVHVRLNERESNPNPYINFISVLDAEEDARQLIRALAAQVKPVMKTHGFTANSLEEYEYNKVFAGRNWNNGETIELVLRSVSGSFLPTSWLMNTLCHELAHIKHMNHGSDFQNLWKQLRNEVRALQNKGYYGDGYWSAGTRLADSSKVTGQGFEFGEFPEYMCGGAQKRTRPTSLRRRRGNQTKVIGPSVHSGRQTAKKRKAGTRVTSKYAFTGDGKALNEDLDEDQKKKGIGFRKQAGSKRAREERALAAERRIMALQSQAAAASSSAQHSGDGDSATESDDNDEEIGENDQDRRKTMLDASQDIDLDNFKYDFPDDFEFNLPHLGSTQGACDLLTSSNEGSTFTNAGPSRDNGKAKEMSRDEAESSRPLKRVKTINDTPSRHLPMKFGFGNLVQDEVQLRKKESIGLALSGNQRLGGSGNSRTVKADESNAEGENENEMEPWKCFMCTLINKPRHLACSACATPRGESSMGGKL